VPNRLPVNSNFGISPVAEPERNYILPKQVFTYCGRMDQPINAVFELHRRLLLVDETASHQILVLRASATPDAMRSYRRPSGQNREADNAFRNAPSVPGYP
jgi:hypothetical protein